MAFSGIVINSFRHFSAKKVPCPAATGWTGSVFRIFWRIFLNSAMRDAHDNRSGAFRIGIFFTYYALLVCICSGLHIRPAAARHAAEEQNLLRVLTFNILHGATLRGDFDLDLIAAIIRDAEPDLVALQEVDFKTNRSRGLDLATELALRTRMTSVFAGAMPFDGGEYGLAVLSARSFIQTRRIALPGQPDREPRIALEVITTLASGDTIRFINTHLDHLEEGGDRIAQARRLVLLASESGYPSVLAGDLNDVPGSEAIRLVEAVWTPAYDPGNPLPTYPSGSPRAKIDYVMYHPSERWQLLESRVIDDPVASDHCAHLVILKRTPGLP
jgi:endonuclease/exonuclease/phosphatase family metal-dependent hydrolase